MRVDSMMGGIHPYVRRKKYTLKVPNNIPKEYERHAYFDAVRKGKSKVSSDKKALKKKKEAQHHISPKVRHITQPVFLYLRT